MLQPRLEFAQGEFLAFEFALESLASAQDSSFFADGVSEATPRAVSLAHTEFRIGGQAHLSFNLQSVIDTHTWSRALGQMQGRTIAVSAASFAANGQGSLSARRGTVTFARFNGAASAALTFQTTDQAGFDISSFADANVFTEATASVTFGFEGTSHCEFVSQTLTHSVAQIASASSAEVHAHWWQQMTGRSVSESPAYFGIESVANATGQSTGASQVTARALAYVQSAWSGNGVAQADLQTQPLQKVDSQATAQGKGTADIQTNALTYVSGTYAMQGRAQVQAGVQGLRSGDVFITGTSVAAWIRGRQVLPFLTASPAAVERPEENRTALWN